MIQIDRIFVHAWYTATEAYSRIHSETTIQTLPDSYAVGNRVATESPGGYCKYIATTSLQTKANEAFVATIVGVSDTPLIVSSLSYLKAPSSLKASELPSSSQDRPFAPLCPG